MAMILEHKSLLQHDPSDFITVEAAASVVPFYSAEYIVALVRSGVVDGIYTSEYNVRVSKAALLAYHADRQAKEKIYDEQNDFYAAQRKALALVEPVLPPLVIPNQALKTTAIIVAGGIVGGFLFFASTEMSFGEDIMVMIANVIGGWSF